MKLRVCLLPLFIFAAFAYGASAFDRAAVDGKVTDAALKEVIDRDLSKFTPSDKFVYN